MKKVFLFLAAVAILAASCTKDATNVAKVNIVGTVINSETKTPIKDVLVKWSNGKSLNTVKTDKNGRYSITGVPSGVYKLIFSKKDFRSDDIANYPANISITEVDANYEEIFTIPDLQLDSLGGTLKTLIVLKNNSNTEIIGANVPFTIALSKYDPVITGTTDALGNINVSGLPNYSTFGLIFNTTIDNYTYNNVSNPYPVSVSFTNPIQISGTKASATPLLIVKANILDNNGVPVRDFDRTSDIVIEFNMPVNFTANLEDNTDFTISLIGATVDFKKFSTDRKRLTVRPLASSVRAKTEYTLSFNLSASSDINNTLSTNITFKTGE